MDRLIVKNFGPLKDVDIELNKINLFIGENGSGKSVLAKIITVILDMDKSNEISIFDKFNDYNINFITNLTILQFYSEGHLIVELKNEEFTFHSRVKELKNNLIIMEDKSNEFFSSSSSEELKRIRLKLENEKDVDTSILKLLEKAEQGLKGYETLFSKYIPTDRNLISLFNKSLSTLVLEEVPLPRFLLSFASEFEKAGNDLKELEFLNVKYINGDGLDRHKVYFNEEDYLPLEHSSSGIQSALPLYLTVKYFAQKHRSIIIEEPEQNLFPKAQKETIQYIIEQMSNKNDLFMMTHSPYVLTALNNLILANDVKTQKGVESIEGIVKEEQCVAFEEVSAYSLVDGKSISIMDIEERLIGVNLIDSISDEVSDTFDRLLEKLD